MIVPLSWVWALGHRAFLRLGFRSRFQKAGRHQLHLYEREGEGSGPPALLVHGMGGNALGFLPIVRRLLKVAKKVVVIELPGHGRAKLGAESPASIQECALAVHEALRSLGEPAVLIGSSLGGALVFVEAALSPERVKGVVGLNPAGAPLAGEERRSVVHAFRGGSIEAAMQINDRLFARPPRGAWLVSRGLAKHWSSPAVQQFVKELQEDVPGLPQNVIESLDKPVLILWGEVDGLLPRSFPDWFARHLKTAKVERLPGVGHLPMQESGRVVGERLQKFYAELAA